MENIRVGYIPVGQAIKIDNRDFSVKKFIKRNKLRLTIAGIFIALLSTYIVLIINFINLIKILN